MDSKQLNIPDLLLLTQQHPTPWRGMPKGTIMGHIHLHVDALAPAVAFYQDILGLDLVMNYGESAAFLSYNGYHHHVGLNTWAGKGAPPPPADAPQLRWYELRLNDAAALPTIKAQAQQHNWPIQEENGHIFIQDPAKNRIALIIHN